MPRPKPIFDQRPPRPAQLLDRLQALFPHFGDDELSQDVGSGECCLHCVMRHFSAAFRASDASEKQLLGLSALIEEAVSVDDLFQNAVSTCFLEHLHQIDGAGVLCRRLSKRSRAHTRA